MRNDTDWRQRSAMETNQSNGRGWCFDTDTPTTTGYLRNVLPVLAFAVAVVGLIALVSKVTA